MSLGEAWKDSPFISGGLDKDGSFALLDYYYEQGGNFIDTANSYQRNESEEFLGEWMETRKIRDEIVLATKYTILWKDIKQGTTHPINFSGNSAKSLKTSLDASLKKLRTTYVDILYVHLWDHTTRVEEMMQALNREVLAGRVLYLGASDMPAWVVVKANMYARQHGMAEFVVYQGLWNVVKRDMEQDIIPMCRDMGLAIAPWGSLGQGRLRTKEQVEQREKDMGSKIRGTKQSDDEIKMAEILKKMGEEHFDGASIVQMALAYCFSKAPNVYPIVGGTKISQLEDNIKAINITLSAEQIKVIEDAVPAQLLFPHFVLGDDPHLTGSYTDDKEIFNAGGVIDFAIKHGPATTSAKYSAK
jgi:aryl-alcohol dehydrogenase-like predicted oxidoreductase